VTNAQEIMHPGVECIDENETLEVAARKMRDLQVGSLPICGADERLTGIITDRDIVIKCLAEGGDPRALTARDLAEGTPIWVEANASEDEVLRLMTQNKIRRLPVMQDHRLVGMISEADVATNLSEEKVARFVDEIYSALPTS
jgi:CBS domain-containing protein